MMKIRGKLKTGRVWLDGKELDPKASQAVVNHSPDGFSWGYPGSGPSQLALAILLEVTGEKEVVLSLYQQFKFDVVARWPQGDFEGNVDVIGWLNEHDVEIITAPDWKDLEEEKVFSFDDNNERDRWLEKNFPKRKCSNSPGLYHTPYGVLVGVRGNTVTVHPDAKANDKPLFAVLFKESMGSFHSMYWKLIHAANENEVRAWAGKYAETLYDEYDGFDEVRQEWTYQDGDYALSIESIEHTTKEAWMEQVFKEALVE